MKESEGEGQWFDRVEALPVIQSLGEVLRKLQSKVHELGGAPKPQAPIGREAKEDQESQNPATKAGEEGVAEDVKVDTGGEEKKASPPKPLQSALSVLVSKQGGGAGASRGPAGHPRKGSAAAAAADETEEVAAEWAEWASGLTAALAMAEYACNVAAEKAEEMAADSALTRCQAGSSTSLVSMGEEKGGGVKKGGERGANEEVWASVRDYTSEAMEAVRKLLIEAEGAVFELCRAALEGEEEEGTSNKEDAEGGDGSEEDEEDEEERKRREVEEEDVATVSEAEEEEEETGVHGVSEKKSVWRSMRVRKLWLKEVEAARTASALAYAAASLQ